MKRHILPLASLSLILAAPAPLLAETSPRPKSADTVTAIGDAAITAQVKTRFLTDERLAGSDISVTTANGVVSLTGKAPSSDARQTAEQLARSIDGVRNVDNLIEAPGLADRLGNEVKAAAGKTGQLASDSWITAKVKSALLADKLTKGLAITVNTSNGVVVLSGQASSREAVEKAVAIARDIEGVATVEAAGLRVSQE